MEGTPYPVFQFEKIWFINCLVGVFFFKKENLFCLPSLYNVILFCG